MVLGDPQTQARLALFVPIALALGALKGALVLRRSAGRTIARIRLLEERAPFWRLYSGWTYLLVLGMIGLGIGLRLLGVRLHEIGYVGVIYLVVGVAMFVASAAYWQADAPGDVPG